MHKITSDRNKNRLIIILEGQMDSVEAKEAADEVVQKLEELNAGMEIINDISKFKPSSEEAQNEIIRAQKAAIQKGASRVVRVIGSVIGKTQFKRLQKEANATYEVIEANSMEDAINFLESN